MYLPSTNKKFSSLNIIAKPAEPEKLDTNFNHISSFDYNLNLFREACTRTGKTQTYAGLI